MSSAAILPALQRLGLVASGETVEMQPLTGGVSSEILRVKTPARVFCVKRALPRLKVAALWEAPVERNAAEAEWVRLVGTWFPGRVPQFLGEDRELGLFAMEFLDADTHPVWKDELLADVSDITFAGEVGRTLGLIHRRSASAPGIARIFAHEATFEAIRIEPYLRATARAHPDLAARIEALATRTLTTRRALIHGDVSPKNILKKTGSSTPSPVFLDAECATYGDPAFDLAFCLNHLMLKGARRPDLKGDYLRGFAALAEAYLAEVDWEPAADLEARCAALLPALFLARVDGKSPVEYLDASQQAVVRSAARASLLESDTTLAAVAERWRNAGA